MCLSVSTCICASQTPLVTGISGTEENGAKVRDSKGRNDEVGEEAD